MTSPMTSLKTAPTPPDHPAPAGRIARWNAMLGALPAPEQLAVALTSAAFGRLALVSSFGAESVVLLHMVARIDAATPVLFLDTELLFPETLRYQRQVAAALGLRDLRIIRPDREALFARDTEGLLHRADPDACCALRKAEPLARALAGFSGWITGRKRFQGGRRANLQPVEADGPRLKLNPLADWRPDDIQAYMARHDLPRHPLVARGYPSIGCAPCTSRAVPGEDPRAGRWRGLEKTECGIHFAARGEGRAA